MRVIENILQPTEASLSQGLIVQQYCNSILQQPSIDFSGVEKLKEVQQMVNSSLSTAKDNANGYSKLQAELIQSLANLKNYSALCATVPLVLPEGVDEKQWIDTLKGLEEVTKTYQSQSHNVAGLLSKFNTQLNGDSSNFTKVSEKANNILKADDGVLADLNKQISSIDSKIDGCIAGSVLSAFAIMGGALMIAIGGIADFVTAGTSTPLVAGGVAVLSLGTAGEIASGVELAGFYKTKATLLQTQQNLQSEAVLLNSLCATYKTLSGQITGAINAVDKMYNAWNLISSDLGSMAGDLEKGIISTGYVRKLFLTAVKNLIPSINSDIYNIEQQLAGVHEVKLKDVSLVEYLNNQNRLRVA